MQNLMTSIRNVGVEHDIMTFSDEPLHGVMSLELEPNIDKDFKQYWKFHYLAKLQELNYDLFVFIDSDHHFVRKPEKDFSEIIGDDLWPSFLESPINAPETKRGDWWGVPNANMVDLYRNFGVNQRTLYSTNGGFWMCKKSFAAYAGSVGFLFRDYQKSKGFDLPEEVSIAVLSHLFSLDYENRFHSKYLDIWASEWTGELKNEIPDNSFWTFQEYMTHKKVNVNPAIVHAMRSKDALTESGKKIFEETKDSRSFISWDEAKSRS